MGSAIVIAVLGPKLLGINLTAACKDYEEKQGGRKSLAAPALPGIVGKRVRSACSLAARPTVSGPSRPRRYSPDAFLCSVYAVRPIEEQPRTRYCVKAT